MKDKFVVYITTNLVNGKIYVGKDAANNPKYLGSGFYFVNALRKHGRENFKKEILEICNNAQHMAEREIFWIAEKNATDRAIGYNQHPGGNGGWTSEATMKAHETLGKEGLSIRNKKVHETMGKEARSARSISIAKKLGKEGCSNRSKKAYETMGSEGKKSKAEKSAKTMYEKMSKEEKVAKIKLAIQKTTPEQRKKRRAIQAANKFAKMMKQWENVQILQKELDGTVVKVWKDFLEIKETLPHFFTGILRVLKGERKKAHVNGKKFLWEARR